VNEEETRSKQIRNLSTRPLSDNLTFRPQAQTIF
jgi:hypothetical protein